MGFQLTRHQLRQTGTQATADFLEETFNDDDEVWSGDGGDIVIGDGGDFDEDDATQYVLLGNRAEYVKSLRDLIEAR